MLSKFLCLQAGFLKLAPSHSYSQSHHVNTNRGRLGRLVAADLPGKSVVLGIVQP